MKRLGWRPLLVARGGVEAHGHEVLTAVASAGSGHGSSLCPHNAVDPPTLPTVDQTPSAIGVHDGAASLLSSLL